MNNLDTQILREMDLSIKQAEAINYALRKVYEALERPELRKDGRHGVAR